MSMEAGCDAMRILTTTVGWMQSYCIVSVTDANAMQAAKFASALWYRINDAIPA